MKGLREMSKKSGKKLILVPEDAVRELMMAANRQGKPFYNFVSEILEYALRIYRGGRSFEEVVRFYEFMDIYRSLGIKIVSNNFFNYAIEKLYQSDRDVLLEKWYEFGRLCGKSLTAKYEDPLRVLEKFLGAKEWELNEISVVNGKDKVRIKCVSSILSGENTELLVKFVDGIMHELKCKPVKQEFIKGVVLLEYKK